MPNCFCYALRGELDTYLCSTFDYWMKEKKLDQVSLRILEITFNFCNYGNSKTFAVAVQSSALVAQALGLTETG